MRFLMLNWRDPCNPLAGGAERVSLAYLAALARRGHEVWWFANTFADCERAPGTIEGVNLIRAGSKWGSWRAARRWHRTQPPFDLVIDQHHGLPWWAPWWRRGRCVAYIHEVLGPIWDAFYPWPVSALGRLAEHVTHRLYRRVPFFTASAFTRDILRRRGVRDVSIIPYGVDTVALAHLEPKPISQPLRLAVVSRLAPNKRVDHALLALALLRRGGVDARLTVVGSGHEDASLRRCAIQCDVAQAVEFCGALPEAQKDAVLRQAHLLLHTSLREGWGLNVIEANAMGTPAAVYPVAGLVESTLHEQTGLVAEAETPEALAAAILSALQRPADYERWRIAARDRAQTFHWDNVLPQACDWLEAQARAPRQSA